LPAQALRNTELRPNPLLVHTFYWAAVTSAADAAHERAMVLRRLLSPDKIHHNRGRALRVSGFFAGARPALRADTGRVVSQLLDDPDVRVIPQSRQRFSVCYLGPLISNNRANKTIEPIKNIAENRNNVSLTAHS
jgi:hypothetical protein